MTADIVKPPQPVDDIDRWVSVMFIACGIKGADDEGARQLLLFSLLQKFADIPDAPPTQNFSALARDVPALARYAVKQLLKALTASGEERKRAGKAADILFERLVSLVED